MSDFTEPTPDGTTSPEKVHDKVLLSAIQEETSTNLSEVGRGSKISSLEDIHTRGDNFRESQTSLANDHSNSTRSNLTQASVDSSTGWGGKSFGDSDHNVTPSWFDRQQSVSSPYCGEQANLSTSDSKLQGDQNYSVGDVSEELQESGHTSSYDDDSYDDTRDDTKETTQKRVDMWGANQDGERSSELNPSYSEQHAQRVYDPGDGWGNKSIQEEHPNITPLWLEKQQGGNISSYYDQNLSLNESAFEGQESSAFTRDNSAYTQDNSAYTVRDSNVLVGQATEEKREVYAARSTKYSSAPVTTGTQEQASEEKKEVYAPLSTQYSGNILQVTSRTSDLPQMTSDTSNPHNQSRHLCFPQSFNSQDQLKRLNSNPEMHSTPIKYNIGNTSQIKSSELVADKSHVSINSQIQSNDSHHDTCQSSTTSHSSNNRKLFKKDSSLKSQSPKIQSSFRDSLLSSNHLAVSRKSILSQQESELKSENSQYSNLTQDMEDEVTQCSKNTPTMDLPQSGRRHNSFSSSVTVGDIMGEMKRGYKYELVGNVRKDAVRKKSRSLPRSDRDKLYLEQAKVAEMNTASTNKPQPKPIPGPRIIPYWEKLVQPSRHELPYSSDRLADRSLVASSRLTPPPRYNSPQITHTQPANRILFANKHPHVYNAHTSVVVNGRDAHVPYHNIDNASIKVGANPAILKPGGPEEIKTERIQQFKDAIDSHVNDLLYRSQTTHLPNDCKTKSSMKYFVTSYLGHFTERISIINNVITDNDNRDFTILHQDLSRERDFLTRQVGILTKFKTSLESNMFPEDQFFCTVQTDLEMRSVTNDILSKKLNLKEQENEKMYHDNAKLSAELFITKKDNLACSRRYDDKTNEINMLNEEITTLRNENHAAMIKLMKAEDKIKVEKSNSLASVSFTSLHKKQSSVLDIDNLPIDQQEFYLKLQNKEKLIRDFKRNVDQLQDLVDDLTSQKEALNEVKTKNTAVIDNLSNELYKAKQDLIMKDQAMSDLKRDFCKKDSEAKVLQTSLRSVTKQNEILTTKHMNISRERLNHSSPHAVPTKDDRSQVAILLDINGSLMRENDRLVAETLNHSSQRAQHSSMPKNNTGTSENSSQNSQGYSSDESYNSKDDAIGELKGRIEMLRNRFASEKEFHSYELDQERSMCEKKVLYHRNQCLELERWIVTQTAKISSMEHAIATLNVQKEGLGSQLSSKDVRITALSQDCEVMHNQTLEMQKQHTEQLRSALVKQVKQANKDNETPAPKQTLDKSFQFLQEQTNLKDESEVIEKLRNEIITVKKNMSGVKKVVFYAKLVLKDILEHEEFEYVMKQVAHLYEHIKTNDEKSDDTVSSERVVATGCQTKNDTCVFVNCLGHHGIT